MRVVAIGDNVVDCYPARREMYPGGSCLNLSIFARRFGAETAYVGAIADDAAGQAILDALRTEGVDTERLRILPGKTAYCVIGHRSNGDRVFLKYDLTVSMFEPSPEDLAFVAGADAVHVGQSSGLDAFLPSLAERAPLSYDFSTRRDAEHRAGIAPLCFLASFSGGNLSETEARGLLEDALALGARWALVTRGEQGAMLGSQDGIIATPASPAEVVDTLGAGDTFIARTLVGLLRHEEPAAMLQAAAIEAAKTCAGFGATGHAAPMQVDAGEIPSVEDVPE